MLGLIYAGLAYYYKDTYLYGTYINDIYATGKTPEEVNRELNELADREMIHIRVSDMDYQIDPEDIGYSYDYLIPLKTYKYSQNPIFWILSVGNEYKNVSIIPLVSFDESLLSREVEKLKLGRLGEPFVCRIEAGENGYILNNNKESIYDERLCLEKIKSRMKEGDVDISLTEECYSAPTYTKDELKAIELSGILDEYHGRSVLIRVDNDIIRLDEGGLDGMLLKDEDELPLLDENNELMVDRESVHSGLDEVLAPYNSYNNHYFTTHDGRVVHLTDGTLGNSVDVDAITDEVYDKLCADTSGPIEVEVKYKHKMDDDEEKYASDIGNTYIEISLDEQHMYYYKNGMLQLDTNVVTGKTSAKCDTKEGVYYVYYKQKNRTLIGETYRSFVKYWMAFNRHVGIHDASWRKNWAEDAYIREGSHGCVNTLVSSCSIPFL